MFTGSYALNGWFYIDKAVGGPDSQLFKKESAIQKPSQTPVFMDANWVELWPQSTDAPARDLYAGTPFASGPQGIGRCTIARHGGGSAASAPRAVPAGEKLPGAIDIGFADGHVETVKLESLWTYYWHQNYQPPPMRPF